MLNHALLRWNAADAALAMDWAGQRKLDKARGSGRIDGLVALAMAIGLAKRAAAPVRSIYDSDERAGGFCPFRRPARVSLLPLCVGACTRYRPSGGRKASLTAFLQNLLRLILRSYLITDTKMAASEVKYLKQYLTGCVIVAAISYSYGTQSSANQFAEKRYKLYEKMARDKIIEVEHFGECQALMNHMAWDLVEKGRKDEATAYFANIGAYERVGLVVGAALGFDRESSLEKLSNGREWYDTIYPQWNDSLKVNYPQNCAHLLEVRSSLLSGLRESIEAPQTNPIDH